MKINQFKIGDKVQIGRYGANASQLNKNNHHLMGAYQYEDWEERTYLIEGTIKLTGYERDLAQSAHLLTTLDGKKAGYVYSYALEPAKRRFRYSVSTNTIWFGGDSGEIKAEDESEARGKAAEIIYAHLQEINRRLDGFDTIEVNYDSLEITEI